VRLHRQRRHLQVDEGEVDLLLRSHPEAPGRFRALTAVYLTWELRPCPSTPGTTIVRLWVDDPDGCSREELEDIWVPVLGRVADAARSTPAT
jgi:hypothetical protein